MARIAVVEDEAPLRADLVEYLSACGHDVIGCGDGKELDRALDERSVEIIILDINLPGEGGFSIAGRLRSHSDVGIIMLTARGLNVDRVVGLEVGADVYMVKPVELRELEAQVRTLARRMRVSQPAPSQAEPRMSDETPAQPSAASPVPTEWIYDQLTWTLIAPDGKSIKLTGNERVFVSLLVSRPGEPVSRDEIFRALGKRGWDPADRSVDSMVRRLRAKGDETFGHPLPIESVHSVGYAFAAPVGLR
ncbi:TorCAD operon transcriptional regulatory protein TorR [Paramagnetospirillum magnetotacticum MS-1]|uniref:TorCAD operon transcriptional regulatory protein TorR n=1 Tax=Paramagnetospirillum magnetotacticum MS-1 TaxID=272627 RepID=A0A0C2YJK7_PARME|nr:response regulator transcription factor [Paramagnetospirillum magnetotacticum]KIL99959.1 TorCAD operon transcriptional regulatory protein TorR [Paramagnetospirillum magnetotacticum MS-1]